MVELEDDGRKLALAIAAAWPPQEVAGHDGWTFRATGGVTRRANSVLVDGEPTDLSAAIAAAEAFYSARDLPAVFWVAEPLAPARAADRITQAGYRRSARTVVLSASTAEVIAARSGETRWSTEASSSATDEWFNVYWEAEPRATGGEKLTREVLLEPNAPAAYVGAVDDDGALVSVGQVVVVDGVGSIQCLATRRAGRRRGAARSVVDRLCAAAENLGATNVVAAVMVDNVASRSLFESFGFVAAHHYEYLVSADR